MHGGGILLPAFWRSKATVDRVGTVTQQLIEMSGSTRLYCFSHSAQAQVGHSLSQDTEPYDR
jgi:hypothetical protein